MARSGGARADICVSADHYPHERFKIEWWYLTANLKGSDGQDYGVHWTLFRQAMNATPNPGGWQSNQTWMAHTAISTPLRFEFSQRFARGGIGQAGVEITKRSTFEAWMDDWLCSRFADTFSVSWLPVQRISGSS